MSDERFIREGFGPCLGHAIEEAGEFIAAAGKTVRFGPDSVNPLLHPVRQERNIDWMRREMDDLRGALDRLDVAIAQMGHSA